MPLMYGPSAEKSWAYRHRKFDEKVHNWLANQPVKTPEQASGIIVAPNRRDRIGRSDAGAAG